MRMFILYLILTLFLTYCNSNQPDITEDQILNTLNELKIKLDTAAIYVIVPSNTCMGCRKKTFEILNNSKIKQKIVFITSDISFSIYQSPSLQIVTDKNKITDRNFYLSEKITVFIPISKNRKIHQFNQLTLDSIAYYTVQ